MSFHDYLYGKNRILNKNSKYSRWEYKKTLFMFALKISNKLLTMAVEVFRVLKEKLFKEIFEICF
jgi:hypothetical protein